MTRRFIIALFAWFCSLTSASAQITYGPTVPMNCATGIGSIFYQTTVPPVVWRCGTDGIWSLLPISWGAIEGTLSNQSDLQTALNAKGTSNFSGVYADLTGKPTLGTAAATAIGDYATAAQGATANSALQPAGNGSALTGLTKAQVSLGNADNTSDASKPVSSAQQTALDAKQNTSAKGAANGYAGLDAGGLVPVAQLPGLPAAWGAITGTLSAQTDLQTALNARQPLDADLTTIASLTPTTDNFMVGTASAWASRTPTQARTQLGLGSLATQSGTFSGTSSGTNTGDQTTVSGNAGTATTLQNARTIDGVSFNGSANISPRMSAAITGNVAIANTETAVVSRTFAANELTAGMTFLIKAYGLRVGTTSASAVVRVRIGTTLLSGVIAATVTAPASTLAVTHDIEALVTIRTAGSGGTASGTLTMGTHLAAVTLTSAMNQVTTDVAVDTTLANQIVGLTFISGNAANTYTFRHAMITRVN